MKQDINKIAEQLAGGMSLDDLRRQQSAFAARFSGSAGSGSDAERSYWQQVFAERPTTKGDLVMTRRTAQEMGYDDARRRFWAILQMRAAHIATLENNPEFEWAITDQFANTLRNMVKYFVNDSTGEIPLTKGLFIFGENGTGKTEIMQAFSRFTTQHDLTKQFVFCSMSEVYSRTRADKEYDPVTINEQQDRCFDEFGRQVGPVLRYGDPLDINEAIIEARYTRFRRYGQITHFIANMAPNEAEAQLSPMVFDRLRSMCTSIEFTGKSKRI